MSSDALVVGSGPAGLSAAEELARAGFAVTLAEAKPSIGRKFLMAGKSGLNITKDEPLEAFLAAYGEARDNLAPIVTSFDAIATQNWARALGQDVFTGSSGRVFPAVMKASPLLRAWSTRLADLGVRREVRWRWHGWDGEHAHLFDTPDGLRAVRPAVTVLALGGASWSRLGSDGTWAEIFRDVGIPLEPFRPANVGIDVAWSSQMKAFAGSPLKSCSFRAGDRTRRGEAVVTRSGLEGSAIYSLSPDLRDGADLMIDLAPDVGVETLTTRLSRPRGKASLANHVRKVTGLPAVKRALVREEGPLPASPQDVARRIKGVKVTPSGTRPLDEAISVAGGVSWDAVSEDLMLLHRPGTFVAGEMLDWEAPTGGYLITACLATGRWAGQAAARFARRPRGA